MLKRFLAPFASLTLTVILLVLAMILVYAGTWAQVDAGIWEVQKRYFHSFFTWVDFQTLLPRPRPGESRIPGGFPMPGGYTIGVLMLVNLLAAHALRFTFTRKRIGIILIHVGLIMLLVGEGLTSGLARESQMIIDEGSTVSYTQDSREVELAIVDPSPADHDRVTVIRQSALRAGADLTDQRLPVQVHIDDFYPNSELLGPMQVGPNGPRPRATAGAGTSVSVASLRPSAGAEGKTDFPSAYVTLASKGQPLGTYLLTTYPVEPYDQPQAVEIAGRTYLIQLRFRRSYKPYSVELLDFAHDRYPGTDIPRNFSSLIVLRDPANHEHRQVLIKMNEPLRYRGETFYQASFRPGDRTTVLQVVKNPAWLMPYIACAIGALGMLIHFGIHLVSFLRRRLVSTPAPRPQRSSSSYTLRPVPAQTLVPALLVLGACAIAFIAWKPATIAGPYDLKQFGRIPILFEGRVQPLDSLARNSLKIISGRETTAVDGTKVPAIQWLADTMARPGKAEAYNVFRIDDRGILGVIGQQDFGRKLYSINDMIARGKELEEQFRLAMETPEKQRSQYQRAVVALRQKLELYDQLSTRLGGLLLTPPYAPGEQWQPIGKALSDAQQSKTAAHPAAMAFGSILTAYNEQKSELFNTAVKDYLATLDAKLPGDMAKVRFEATFNHLDPFLWCMVLYVLVFVMAAGSWLGWTKALWKGAVWTLALAVVIHTAGLAGRVYLSGRPPVTNLASSAIFIAWGAALLALFQELIFRNGIGAVTASVLGFTSLLIAHRLSLQGDTLKVLVAVLDTNFWLATHVITITLGYASTFLAGMLAIIYVIRGLFTRSLDEAQASNLTRMIYGIVCFATLFSFVGTILGGIWADQSWGRFWGWDPKENGAVLIVLWNALILHARWAGLVRQRGLALLAIGGNIVTSWSWFGTNMLGVGLHSYGFMDAALRWLLLFVSSQLILIGLGSIPLSKWRSFRSAPKTAIAPQAHALTAAN